MSSPSPSPTADLGLLPAGPDDRYFDYCLQAYSPRRPPAGKLRAENILWRSLDLAGARDGLEAPLKALQGALGRDLTVWGVKLAAGRLWWELYLYDPQKEDVAATATAIARTLSPWLETVPSVPETIPYMMVSFDLFPDSVDRGTIPEVNLYLTGTDAMAGRSYSVRAEGFQLENTYQFFEPKACIDEVLPLVKSSAFVRWDDPVTLARVLVPQLFGCKRVCVSKKRFCDAVYFSGIDVDQLLWFLRRFEYPEPLVAFVDAHHDELDHLYFDVGIDYRMDGEGRLVHPKTSFYGTL